MYTLDRTKALDNKRQICNNEHINYAMKPGKNFVVEYSTAAYELAKTVTAQILQSNDFKENFAIVEQIGQDQTNAIVDLVYKIYNRKQNGQTGNQLKFAINMYHTQCKMNVNGNRVDIFVNYIFDKIFEKTKLNVQNLDIVNSTIASQISPLLSSSSIVVKKGIQNTNVENEVMQIRNEQDRLNNSKQIESCTTEVTCIKETDDIMIKMNEMCPFCRAYVNKDGIACDQCDFWYHFLCIGIADTSVKENMEKADYICHFCSEDNLYTDKAEKHQLEHIAEKTDNTGNTITLKDIHSDMNVIQERQYTDLYTTKSSSNLENCQSLDELLLEERNMLESYAYDTQPDKEVIDTNIDPEETVLKSTYNNSQKTERANDCENKKDKWEIQPVVEDHNTSNRQKADYAGTAKTRRNTKQKTEKDDILINQKSRILNLENEVKQLRNTLITHKEGNADIERPIREHPNVGYRHNDCNTCNHHKCCQQTHHNDRYKDDVIEQRLRIVEMQMIQNMCITTALNTHVALQNRPPTHMMPPTYGYYPMNIHGPMHPHLKPSQHRMPPQYSAPFSYYPTTNVQPPPDTYNHHFPQQQVQQQYGQNVTHNQGFSQHQSQHHQDQTVEFRQHPSQHQAQQQPGHNGAQNQHLHQHQSQLQSDHIEAFDILPRQHVQQHYEQDRNETSIKDNYGSNPPIITSVTGNNVENQLQMGKLIRDINSESDRRMENTNSTQNQPNELGPKILGGMIQSRKAVVDKKPNEVSYEQPKRINHNINIEPHSFADTRDKKISNCTDMRQQENDRKREELNHLFRLESLQKHPPERIQQKRL